MNKFKLCPRENVTTKRRNLMVVVRSSDPLFQYIHKLSKKYDTKKTEVIRQMLLFAMNNSEKI